MLLRMFLVPVLEIPIHDKQCNLQHWEWMDLHSIITFSWRVNLNFLLFEELRSVMCKQGEIQSDGVWSVGVNRARR